MRGKSCTQMAIWGWGFLFCSTVALGWDDASIDPLVPPKDVIEERQIDGSANQTPPELPFAFWHNRIDLGEILRESLAILLCRTIHNAPRQPNFLPLEPADMQARDRILEDWERASAAIERLSIRFHRWEYDPQYAPPDTYHTFSTGTAKYVKPRHSSFQVERSLHYTSPKTAGEKPQYVPHADQFVEHWRCDGKSLFRFDYARKQLVESELPPLLHERCMTFGFLPFFVNVKVEELKKHFTIRVITPEDAKGEDWLALYPKTKADANTYYRVELIIDREDSLPKAIQVFNPRYRERTNPARTVFQFAERHKNGTTPKTIVCVFPRAESVPKRWEHIVLRYSAVESPELTNSHKKVVIPDR